MLIKKNKVTKKFLVPQKWQKKQKISDKEVINVAKIAEKLHEHYFFPQDCEFALDKKKKDLFCPNKAGNYIKRVSRKTINRIIKRNQKAEDQIEDKIVLLSGSAASPGIGWGAVVLVKSKKEIGKVKQGDVLVTSMTTPDFVPAMKKVSAIVTDKGGLTSHAAIVSRELGVPCIVGTETATKVLRNGEVVTVDGGKGKVYKGGLTIKSKIIEPGEIFHGKEENLLLKTATKLYVNLADWSIVKEVAQKNVDGVGLLRAEFMMAEIGVHPKKIIAEKKREGFYRKTFGKNRRFLQRV